MKSAPSTPSRPGSSINFLNTTVVLQALLLVGVVSWIFWPSLQGGFIGDDVWYLTSNPLLQDPHRLWKAWFAPGSWVEYYPLEESVQYFQWLLWHRQTLGYHVTNVVLHLAGCFLLWHLFRKLGLRFAWLGALLFAVHPENVDSVCEIVELKNTLSLPFAILAMSLYIDYAETQSGRSYLWAVGAYLASMVSKITFAPFPLIILLYAWWTRGRIAWSDVRACLPFLVISVALGLTTMASSHIYAHPMKNWDPVDDPLGGPLFRFVLAGQVIAFYFARFFLPVNPVPIYPQWPVEPSHALSYLPWAVLALALGWLWTKRRSWGRPVLFGVGFFLIGLLPFLGFKGISYMNYTYILDHMLYIPMIGLVGLCVACVDRLAVLLSPPARLWSVAALIVAFALLASQSHYYAAQFVNEEAIDRYNLKFVDGVEIQNNLAIVLANRGDLAEAEEHYRAALRDRPNDAKILHNLGGLLFKTNRVNEAIEAYTQSSLAAPEVGGIHAALADTLFAAGRIPEALEHFRAAIRLNFETDRMYGRAGECLFLLGKNDEGVQQFQRAVEIAPTSPLARYNLAKGLCKTGQLEAGIEQYQEALKLNPDYAEAHNNLGIALFNQGKADEALKQFQLAVQSNPAFTEAQDNLRLAESKQGETEGKK